MQTVVLDLGNCARKRSQLLRLAFIIAPDTYIGIATAVRAGRFLVLFCSPRQSPLFVEFLAGAGLDIASLAATRAPVRLLQNEAYAQMLPEELSAFAVLTGRDVQVVPNGCGWQPASRLGLVIETTNVTIVIHVFSSDPNKAPDQTPPFEFVDDPTHELPAGKMVTPTGPVAYTILGNAGASKIKITTKRPTGIKLMSACPEELALLWHCDFVSSSPKSVQGNPPRIEARPTPAAASPQASDPGLSGIERHLFDQQAQSPITNPSTIANGVRFVVVVGSGDDRYNTATAALVLIPNINHGTIDEYSTAMQKETQQLHIFFKMGNHMFAVVCGNAQFVITEEPWRAVYLGATNDFDRHRFDGWETHCSEYGIPLYTDVTGRYAVVFGHLVAGFAIPERPQRSYKIDESLPLPTWVCRDYLFNDPMNVVDDGSFDAL